MPPAEQPPVVVNVDDAPEIERKIGPHWGAAFKSLTPSMRPRGGQLGINLFRVEAGRSVCPFHAHQKEDEAFYILSGRGVLRYGDELHSLRPGDCVSCPAGTGVAHQICNPHEEDLVYLAIGQHAHDEVCYYPDSDKLLVRGLGKLGRLEAKQYMDDEPERPRIFDLIEAGGAGAEVEE